MSPVARNEAIYGAKRFPPVGRCIYCAAGEDLRKEHIVPYSLNGVWVLPRASCGECATVTGRLELELTRGALRPIREALKLQSRKGYPKDYPLQVHDGTAWVERRVAAQDHLLVLPLPIFAPPVGTATERVDPGIELREPYTHLMTFAQAKERLIGAVAMQGGRARTEIEPMQVAQLLAKIAHGIAVASFGLADIAEPYVARLALGDHRDARRWIGCEDQPVRPPDRSGLHVANVYVRRGFGRDGIAAPEVIVRLRLFAHWEGPEYTVIAARLKEGGAWSRTAMA